MPEALDGLLTFFASHHAIRAEKVLSRAGLTTRLVPGPKELSPNCGVAVRFIYEMRESALQILADQHVQVDEVHHYRPDSDGRKEAPNSRLLRRSRR